MYILFFEISYIFIFEIFQIRKLELETLNLINFQNA